MKKIVLCLLLFLCFGLLTSCDSTVFSNNPESLSAYTVLQNSQKQFSSLEMGVDCKAGFDVNGQKSDVVVNGTCKEVIRSDTDIDMAIQMKTTGTGLFALVGTGETLSYYKDGYWYTNAAGQKTKAPMELSQAKSKAMINVLSFDESLVKESNIDTSGNTTTMTFVLDAEAVSGLAQQGVGAYGLGQLTLSDVHMTVILDKDNNLKEMSFTFDMLGNAGGQSLKCDYDVTIRVMSYNNTTIDFPSDLDTY